jgi:hypothetical protein
MKTALVGETLKMNITKIDFNEDEVLLLCGIINSAFNVGPYVSRESFPFVTLSVTEVYYAAIERQGEVTELGRGVMDSIFNKISDGYEQVTEMKIGDTIEVIWNQECLPMEEANGHYPNEREVVTVESEDEDFWYCTNTVEIQKGYEHHCRRVA